MPPRPLDKQCEALHRAIQLLRWVEDHLHAETPEHRAAGGDVTSRRYLTFAGGITQKDSDAIATVVNHLLVLTDVPGMVTFSCGEFFYIPKVHQGWAELIRRQDKERP